MSNINEYKITVDNTLEENRYNLSINRLSYTLPILKTSRGPGQLGGTSIPLDKPVNNQVFSLSGKTENGSIEFDVFERFNPTTIDSVYNDRSYDPDAPTGEEHTLDHLITELEASGVSGSTAEADRLKARFTQDGNGNYVVRTVSEQRKWLRDVIHNPGLFAEWTFYGPSYDYRTVDGSNNPTGTPIFLENADIEPSSNTEGRGLGNIGFKVGGRL